MKAKDNESVEDVSREYRGLPVFPISEKELIAKAKVEVENVIRYRLWQPKYMHLLKGVNLNNDDYTEFNIGNVSWPAPTEDRNKEDICPDNKNYKLSLNGNLSIHDRLGIAKSREISAYSINLDITLFFNFKNMGFCYSINEQ